MTTDDPKATPPKHTGGKFKKGVSGNPGGKKSSTNPPPAPQTPQPTPQVGLNPQPHAEVERSANATGKRETRFKPGNPGKPKGTSHHATRLYGPPIVSDGGRGGDRAAYQFAVATSAPQRTSSCNSAHMQFAAHAMKEI